jgi:hypothetical protein
MEVESPKSCPCVCCDLLSRFSACIQAVSGFIVRAVNQPFINVDEQIDKVVGRRTRTPDAFKSGMQLQSLAVALHRSLGHRWAAKGVYRFKTHEEADEWMNRMLARSQTPAT